MSTHGFAIPRLDKRVRFGLLFPLVELIQLKVEFTLQYAMKAQE